VPDQILHLHARLSEAIQGVVSERPDGGPVQQPAHGTGPGNLFHLSGQGFPSAAAVEVLHPVHGHDHRTATCLNLGHFFGNGLYDRVGREGHHPAFSPHIAQVGGGLPIRSEQQISPTGDQVADQLLGEGMPPPSRPETGFEMRHRQAHPPGHHHAQQSGGSVTMHNAYPTPISEHLRPEPPAAQQAGAQTQRPSQGLRDRGHIGRTP